MLSVRKLASRCAKWNAEFERRHPVTLVASVMDDIFSPDCLDSAIDGYRAIIRKNIWYFPDLQDVSVRAFLKRWESVHSRLFASAVEIFCLIAQSRSMSVLAQPELLERAILLETMRGWVGKRSPTGPDRMVEDHVSQLEGLLSCRIGPHLADEIITRAGLYQPETGLLSAENELVSLFREYHQLVGYELAKDSIEDANSKSNGIATRILRGFCRYSVTNFNRQYLNLLTGAHRLDEMARPGTEEDGEKFADEVLSQVEDRKVVAKVKKLLEEIRILNFVNLNLEVKHSFKSWVGLMHYSVFRACSQETSISTDVYAMHQALVEKGKL